MKKQLRIVLASLSLTALSVLNATAADLFKISGKNLEGSAVSVTVTDETLLQQGMTEIKTKLVSQGDTVSTVRGLEIRPLLKSLDLQGNNLYVEALDGYALDVPRADIEKYKVLLAVEVDGKRLTVREKGPAWVVYPVSDHKELDAPIFEARSVWQIKSILIGNK